MDFSLKKSGIKNPDEVENKIKVYWGMKNAAIKISIVGIERKVFPLRCQIIRRVKTFINLKLF